MVLSRSSIHRFGNDHRWILAILQLVLAEAEAVSPDSCIEERNPDNYTFDATSECQTCQSTPGDLAEDTSLQAKAIRSDR
jgi:hypothetical protein